MLTGDYSADLPRIFESLKDAAYDDWIYHEVFRRKISHDDGWGYAVLGAESVHYDRIYKPVFECDLPLLPGNGAMIMHARKAAEGEPLGPLNCHPHHRSDSKWVSTPAEPWYIDGQVPSICPEPSRPPQSSPRT